MRWSLRSICSRRSRRSSGPPAVRPERARRTARTCCRRCWARRRPRAPCSSSRPARCRCRQGQWKYIAPGQGSEDSTRTRTRSSATIPSRSSTIWRRTRGSGTISPRRVRRRCASWPRCWRESGAPAHSRAAGTPPEHRPGHRRRLVVSSRRHLRRSDGQHAEFRSCRAGRSPVHARLRRGAVVHAVARGAADRPGRAPA